MENAKTLTEQAYNFIRQKIIENEFKPGEVLGEVKLSKMLDISRTPVSKALQQLVYDGFAVTDANKSVRVATITEKDVQDITSVRLELETLAVRLLAKTATPEGIAKLRELCRYEHEILKNGTATAAELIQIDYKFHVAIAEMTGNAFLIEMIGQMKGRTNLHLALSHTMDPWGQSAADEHEEMVDFMEKGQFDYAEVAVKRHILKVGSRYF